MSLKIDRCPRSIKEFRHKLNFDRKICFECNFFSDSFNVVNVSPLMPFPIKSESCYYSKIVLKCEIFFVRFSFNVRKNSQ